MRFLHGWESTSCTLRAMEFKSGFRCKCSGNHARIIQDIVEHRLFLDKLEEFKPVMDAQVAEVEAGTLPRITIAIYCRHGRHRSVGLSIILAYVIQHYYGDRVSVREPKHYGLLPPPSWMCKGCRLCTDSPMHESKASALERALDMYSSC